MQLTYLWYLCTVTLALACHMHRQHLPQSIDRNANLAFVLGLEAVRITIPTQCSTEHPRRETSPS